MKRASISPYALSLFFTKEKDEILRGIVNYREKPV